LILSLNGFELIIEKSTELKKSCLQISMMYSKIFEELLHHTKHCRFPMMDDDIWIIACV